MAEDIHEGVQNNEKDNAITSCHLITYHISFILFLYLSRSYTLI